MGHMDHNTWYERVTSGATERAAALKSGVTTSTLNRQRAKGELSPESVIALSRGYGVNPVQGLIATGYLLADETANLSEDELADTLSDRALIRSLARRLGEDEQELEAEAAQDGANVVHFPSHDGTIREWDDAVPYAADGSPDEDALRDERGEDFID